MNWGQLAHAYGPADDVSRLIRALIADDAEERDQVGTERSDRAIGRLAADAAGPVVVGFADDQSHFAHGLSPSGFAVRLEPSRGPTALPDGPALSQWRCLDDLIAGPSRSKALVNSPIVSSDISVATLGEKRCHRPSLSVVLAGWF